jgi:hypothetical protein
MTDSVREELLGRLLGALDQEEQELIDAQLAHDPELRAELAQLSAQAAPLEAALATQAPPAGLAERTCAFVFSHSKPMPAGLRRRFMSPAVSVPAWISRVAWTDVGAAICLLAAATLLIFPAIQNSRFHSQVAACQRNLQELGIALARYSETHNGAFPQIPTKGPLAAAGVYAPVLLRDQYLTEAARVVCPGSSLAAQGKFHLPSLDELKSAAREKLVNLQLTMGGSYGYGLGYTTNGVYHDALNLHRSNFAVMADAPSLIRLDRQSDNHGGRGQNVLFEDGRVQFITTTLINGADDIYSNNLGQLSAGLNPHDAVIAPSPIPPIK